MEQVVQNQLIVLQRDNGRGIVVQPRPAIRPVNRTAIGADSTESDYETSMRRFVRVALDAVAAKHRKLACFVNILLFQLLAALDFDQCVQTLYLPSFGNVA